MRQSGCYPDPRDFPFPLGCTGLHPRPYPRPYPRPNDWWF